MKVGDILRISKCSYSSEIIGEDGQIVQLLSPEIEEYGINPVLVKMVSGNHRNQLYSFSYREIEEMATVGAEDEGEIEIPDVLEKVFPQIVATAEMETKQDTSFRMGKLVRVIISDPKSELSGELGQIVDMQIQEVERYRTYPLWVKMLTGKKLERICGFQYEEVQLIPEICPQRLPLVQAIDEFDSYLKWRIGGEVKIIHCEFLSGLIGECGEIVDLQIQEFEKYRTFPVWVKILTGKSVGKIYGFHYDELDIKSDFRVERMNQTPLYNKLDDILGETGNIEELARLMGVMQRIRRQAVTEKASGFWEGKKPCWEMIGCSELVRNKCPAFSYQIFPCWQLEGTCSKHYSVGSQTYEANRCQSCQVYQRWGNRTSPDTVPETVPERYELSLYR
jgi:hypothetical protein